MFDIMFDDFVGNTQRRVTLDDTKIYQGSLQSDWMSATSLTLFPVSRKTACKCSTASILAQFLDF